MHQCEWTGGEIARGELGWKGVHQKCRGVGTGSTQSSFCAEELYTDALLHREACTQGGLYTQKLLRRKAFTAKLLDTEAFSQGSF